MYEIDVQVIVIADINLDEFTDKFMEWIEANGWTMGGGIGPYTPKEN